MKVTYFNIFILLVLAGLSLGSCSTKMGPLDTTFTVVTQTQRVQGETAVGVDGWIGYYLYSDSLTYTVDSFENALDGYFAPHGGSGEGVSADGQAAVQDSIVVFPNLDQTPALMLLVHPDDSLYAWRQIDLVDGLPNMSTKLIFKAYQASGEEGKVITETLNNWNVIYASTTVETEEEVPTSTYKVNPTYQETEGGEKKKSTAWKGYYYVVDHADYEIRNLANAIGHIVHSTTSGEVLTGEWTDAENKPTEHILFSEMKERTFLLVIYEESLKVFAYRYIEIAEGSDLTEPLNFLLDKYAPYKDIWNIVVPAKEEEQGG